MNTIKPTKPEEKNPERREKEQTEEEKNKKESLPDQPSAIVLHDNPLSPEFIQVVKPVEEPQLVYSKFSQTTLPKRSKAYRRKRISRKLD